MLHIGQFFSGKGFHLSSALLPHIHNHDHQHRQQDYNLYVPSPLLSAKISKVSQASGDDSSVHRKRTWIESHYNHNFPRPNSKNTLCLLLVLLHLVTEYDTGYLQTQTSTPFIISFEPICHHIEGNDHLWVGSSVLVSECDPREHCLTSRFRFRHWSSWL